MFWWQKKGEVEIYINGERYSVKRDDFVKYLENETARCLVDEEFYTVLITDKDVQQKAMYFNVLHFILCNMKNTVTVWIYNDGAVRLYQDDEVRSIWWDTPRCYTVPINLYLLKKLKEFLKQYN